MTLNEISGGRSDRTMIVAAPRQVGRPSSVAAAMVTDVRMFDRTATIGDVAEFFADDHVHMALVVDRGMLVTTIDRGDLNPSLDSQRRAMEVGTLNGRWVGPLEDLSRVRDRMVRTSRRRLAVVGDAGELLGLLCLKRHGQGFCHNQDVLARRAHSLR